MSAETPITSRNRPTTPTVTVRVVVLLIAALCAIYVLSDALQFRYWSTENELDGSYWFAFTKLLSLDQYFGRDVFFTYGPLAQYFGPVMPDAKLAHGVVVHLVSLWLAVCVFVCTYYLIAEAVSDGRYALPVGALFGFILPVVGSFPTDWWFFFLLLLLCILAYTSQEQQKTRRYVLLMMSTAVVALNFKFSSGIIALGVLVLAIVFLRRRLGWRFALGLLLLFIACSYAAFWLLTGSAAWHTYMYAGLVVSETYSEIMIFHDPTAGSDVSRYLVGLAYAGSFVGTVAIIAATRCRNGIAAWGLVLSAMAVAFVAYKHAFVRNDLAHNLNLYRPLLPVGVVATGKALSSARRRVSFLVPAVVLSVAFFAAMGWGDPVIRSTSLWQGIVEPASASWSGTPQRLWQGIFGTPSQKVEERNFHALRARRPHLFARLDELCSGDPKSKPTITFYPWEIMYSAATECRWQPMPSLQIYAEGPNRYSHRLDAAVLESGQAPEIVVLSKEAVDWRNSVSEFTNWLEPLFLHYEPHASEDDLAILTKADPSSTLGRIVCRETGPGLFLRGKVAPLPPIQAALFKIGTAAFKAPELSASILYIDGDGKLRVIYSRSYYSQMEQGVYFSNLPINTLLSTARADEDERSAAEIAQVVSAVLVRNGGVYNLPTIEASLPIKIEYCAPERYHAASQQSIADGDWLSSPPPDILSLPVLFFNQIAPSLQDSRVVHSATGIRPEIRFGLGLPAEMVRRLRVKMNLLPIVGQSNAEVKASLYFLPAGRFELTENQRFDFSVKADGEVHAYELEVTENEEWQGVIGEIRLIPARDLTPDTYPLVKGTHVAVEAQLDTSVLAAAMSRFVTPEPPD
jgi:hypothetical protein